MQAVCGRRARGRCALWPVWLLGRTRALRLGLRWLMWLRSLARVVARAHLARVRSLRHRHSRSRCRSRRRSRRLAPWLPLPPPHPPPPPHPLPALVCTCGRPCPGRSCACFPCACPLSPPAVFALAWARSHYRLAPDATASPQSPPSPPPRRSRPRRHRLAAIATVSPPSPPPRLVTMPLPPPCHPSRRRVRVRVVTACRPFRCAGRSAAPPGRARRLLIARSRARWPVRGVVRRAATAVVRLVAA